MDGFCGSWEEGFSIGMPRERLCGGLYGLEVLMNGLLKPFKLCTMGATTAVRLRDGESKGVTGAKGRGSLPVAPLLSPLLFTICLEALV